MTVLSTGSTTASLRMADALLQSVGGTAVALRFPLNAASGQDAEQLGLSEPAFEDVPLGPAVFRRVQAQVTTDNRAKYELLISATAINAQMAALGLSSVTDLFSASLGVVVRDTLLCVLAVTASEAFGQAYMFRVQVEGPQGELL